jgi:hypothetical protein
VTTRLFEVVQDDRTTGLGTVAVVVEYADRGLLQLTEQSTNSLLRDLTFPFFKLLCLLYILLVIQRIADT